MGPPNGAVAQLGEHLLCKQGVTGSRPVSSTKGKRPARSGSDAGLGWRVAGRARAGRASSNKAVER